MIIIFAIFLTSAFAQSQESYNNKYIDLLPHKEKQEFLDNVARRIMESFENNGTNTKQGSRELTDEQLKKHNFYVHSVMKKESAAIKARRNKREDRSSGESKENDGSKEDIEVKSFQFRDNDVDKIDTPEADNIDLAVAGMNRRSYDDNHQENNTDTPKTDNITEDTSILQTQWMTSDVNSKETTVALTMKKPNEKDEKNIFQGASTLNSEMKIHKSNLVESTTKVEDFPIETTNATAIENSLKYETSSVASTLQEFDNVSKETSTSSKIHILEYDTATNSNNVYLITEGNDYLVNSFVPSPKATESHTQHGSDSTLTSSLTDESTTDTYKNTPDKSLNVSTTVNSQVFTTTTQNIAQANTATTENYSTDKDGSTNKRLQNNSKTTTFTPILTTNNFKEEQNTKKTKNIKLSKIIKPLDKDSLVSYVANKALNNIKNELELKNKGKFIDSEIKTTNKENTHLNHYQVYEIPWPIKRDNQPFIRSQEPIKDQPYYVPVYKYSPSFAYYNPKNRLGPNEVEENSIELDSRHLREGNNDVHDTVEPNEFILQLNNDMRKFIHLFHWNNTFTITTTTTTPIELSEEEPWGLLLNPFANRPRRSTTRAPRTPFRNRRTRRTTTIRAPSDDSESIEKKTTKSTSKMKWYGMPPKFGSHAKTTRVPSDDSESKEKDTKSTTKKEFYKNQLFGYHKKDKEKNTFINLAKLHTFKLPLMRSKTESKVSIYMNVLKDLILEDSKSLKQYDWLTTTVQIQSALTKILNLIKRMRQSKQLHPADLQVLRYMIFLHNFSLEVKKENNKMGNKLTEKVKSPKSTRLKGKSLVNRDWVYLWKPQPDLAEEDELSHLHEFLVDVQDRLFDLHEAIGQIADVTKFDRQNWYDNLKQLYLSADEKQLRELLLHISMSRLVDLVEHSCKHSLNHDFLKFVKTNKKDAKRIVEEMLFINDIVHEIAKNNK